MSIVAVTGDCSTTTALALAVAWPAPRRVVLVEADPSGGSLAAWLGVPRRPGLAELVSRAHPISDADLESVVQAAPSGIDVIVAPVTRVEAAATVSGSGSALRAFGTDPERVVLVDTGRSVEQTSTVVDGADLVLVTHHQDGASARASAVRLERLRDTCCALAESGRRVVVAVRGARPYGPDELTPFLGVDVLPVADDPYAAALLAGRAGSARRLLRSPLLRSAATLACRLEAELGDTVGAMP